MIMNISKNSFTDNTSHLNNVAQTAFRVYWLFLVVLIFSRLDVYVRLSYIDFPVSDWLINWEGGFVRRGLGGQLLYWLYQLHPFDVIVMLKRITGITSILLLMLLLWIFQKEGWSLAVLPLSCCLYFTFFRVEQRRDLLLLLMAYSLFVFYRNYIRRRSAWWLSLFVLLSVVMTLFHESSFIFTVPLTMVYGWTIMCKRVDKWSLKSVLSYLFPFVPAFVSMGAVCLCKGDEQTATAIWNSWHGLFAAYPDGINSYASVCGTLGDGVDALTWKTGETFRFHLFSNFVGDYGWKTHAVWEYFTFLVWLWLIVAVYFLITHINAVDVSLYPLAPRPQQKRISNVLLVQLVFALPFFTFLSIDWGRTLSYWVFPALFALHVFGDLKLKPVEKLTEKIQSRLSYGFFGTSLCFFIVALLLPVVHFGTPRFSDILNFNLHL